MTDLAAVLREMRGDAPASARVFPISQRRIAAKRAGINTVGLGSLAASCHASHAIDRGATLAEVQTTLGHANVATTSGYLHARPNTSSGLKLDEGIFQ